MKSITRFGIIAAMCGAFISSLSAQASAAGSWVKLPQNYVSVAVASYNNLIYSLHADVYYPGSGYQLWYQDYTAGNHHWYALGGLKAIALTVDSGNDLFLVSADNHVYIGPSSRPNAFNQLNNNNCAGGALVYPSQTLRHSTVVIPDGDVTNLGLTILTTDGRVASWEIYGQCWSLFPALPSGTATDVSAVSAATASGGVWALANDQKIYGWDGAAWQWLQNSGIALGINSAGLEIGSDARSMWITTGSNFVVMDMAWGPAQGPILSIGTSYKGTAPSEAGFADSVALGGDSGIWYHINGWP